MKEIKLTQNQVALVDDEDYECISRWKWYAVKCGSKFYAVHVSCENGYHIRHLMHRVVMGAHCGTQIDHINGDGLDNRKQNLRFCDNAENQHNRHVSIRNTSGFKGVSLIKKTKKWRAQILIRGKYFFGEF